MYSMKVKVFICTCIENLRACQKNDGMYDDFGGGYTNHLSEAVKENLGAKGGSDLLQCISFLFINFI